MIVTRYSPTATPSPGFEVLRVNVPSSPVMALGRRAVMLSSPFGWKMTTAPLAGFPLWSTVPWTEERPPPHDVTRRAPTRGTQRTTEREQRRLRRMIGPVLIHRSEAGFLDGEAGPREADRK